MTNFSGNILTTWLSNKLPTSLLCELYFWNRSVDIRIIFIHQYCELYRVLWWLVVRMGENVKMITKFSDTNKFCDNSSGGIMYNMMTIDINSVPYTRKQQWMHHKSYHHIYTQNDNYVKWGLHYYGWTYVSCTCLLHCRHILYCWTTKEALIIAQCMCILNHSVINLKHSVICQLYLNQVEKI